MNVNVIEGKLDKQSLFQCYGIDKDKFAAESERITQDLLQIRRSAFEQILDVPDMVLETKDNIVSVYFD